MTDPASSSSHRKADNEKIAPGLQAPPSAWSPLRHRSFRWLWIATVASNIGTWMQSVSAAWLMTSLSPSALMVALVQAATSVPIVLLAIPAGALADIVDRRRYLLMTQFWMLFCVLGLSWISAYQLTTPYLLLLITFALGCGTALSMPAWAAVTPELVPRDHVRAAVTLNGLGVNISRAVGPAIAGLLLSWSGPTLVFLLNAASFLGVVAVLIYWRRPVQKTILPTERFLGGMVAGLRYARHSKALLTVLVRAGAFFVFASALWSLLPVWVSSTLRGGPGMYGLLLGCVGVGAVLTGATLPRWRKRLSSDHLVTLATLLYALSLLALARSSDLYVIGLALCLAGGAWISIVSTLQVAALSALPEWVRGRGVSVFMIVFMGSMTGGSLLWGYLADLHDVATGFLLAAAGAVLAIPLTWLFRLGPHESANLDPSMHWPTPLVDHPPEHDQGPVLVRLEYTVDLTQQTRFVSLMQDLRHTRLRDGAYWWGLFQDAADRHIYAENFVVESWLEHLRQHHRVTISDRLLQEEVAACLAEGTTPRVTHSFAVAFRKSQKPRPPV